MKNLSKDDNPEFTSFTSKMILVSILAGASAGAALIYILTMIAEKLLK